MSIRLRSIRRAAQTAAALATFPVVASAQKSFIGMTGAVFRYHGDTIWMSQDSTEQRSITHGDTVANRMMINDRIEHEMGMVVHGDSASILYTIGRDGQPRAPGGQAMMPATIATFLQKMLEMESRTSSIGDGLVTRFAPPALPDTTIIYSLSAASRISQHRDTVRVIKGCPSERADTTTFLMFGGDSTRRLTAPQRVFGQPMAQTLIAQMRGSLLQAMAAGVLPAPPADLPKAPGSC